MNGDATETAVGLAIEIGEVTIPYRVRPSTRARKKRLVVTPEGVEVVVPLGTRLDGDDGVRAFVHQKRRWLFDTRRQITERHERLLTQHWASGAKLQYRGRWLMLDVRPASVDSVEITCRSKLHVRVPESSEGVARLESVREAFHTWLRTRAERDLHRLTRRHQATLGTSPAGVRLSDSKHAWGTCGKDRIIRVHWRLIQAPAVAMEYVVAHELCHLLERSHSPAFWSTLAQAMPEWAEAKAALERWERQHRAV